MHVIGRHSTSRARCGGDGSLTQRVIELPLSDNGCMFRECGRQLITKIEKIIRSLRVPSKLGNVDSNQLSSKFVMVTTTIVNRNLQLQLKFFS
jgi:hypothetical protein